MTRLRRSLLLKSNSADSRKIYMARDIDNPILWHEAEAMFIRDILPDLILQETKWQGGKWQHADECFRSEEWNNWTDSLCKSGRISDWQYENWSHPSVCDG